MCLSRKNPEVNKIVVNRWNGQPLGLNSKELRNLEKDFNEVNKGDERGIDPKTFRENMGVLGLKTTALFADRLFACMDIDNDKVVNFNDFVEYMDIVRNGSQYYKARLSFRIIDSRKIGWINRLDFVLFMNDLLQVWSSVTNAAITDDVKRRANHYVDSLFGKSQQTNKALSFEDYYRQVCQEYKFMSAFEFITNGITDEDGQIERENLMRKQLKRVEKELQRIQMLKTAQQSAYNELRPLENSLRVSRIYEIDGRLNMLLYNIRNFNMQIQQQNYFRSTTLSAQWLHKNQVLHSKHEGKVVFFGDSQWNVVLNMMIGIQTAINSAKGYSDEVRDPPKDFYLKYDFELIPKRFGGSKHHENIHICRFVDYAPNTFSHIRKLFDVSNQLYIRSVGPDRFLAALVMGQMVSMTSQASQGKSGSLFYYSSDGHFMLKTVSRQQFKLLRTILEKYYYHLLMHRQTLITKIFGLHKLIERDIKGRSIRKHYLTVLANVFDVDEKIQERYDLKGSFVGRATDIYYKGTRKDLDFLKRPPFMLNIVERNNLLQQIYNDTIFLSRLGIMDYSLLVGVIRKESIIRANRYHGPPFRIYESRESDEKYVMGIIDILTQFTGKKKIQSMAKRLFYGDGVSAVPPDEYAQRFCKFMSDKVFR